MAYSAYPARLPGGLYLATLALLAVVAAADAGLLASGLAERALLERVAALGGAEVDKALFAELEASDARRTRGAFVMVLAFVACAVVSLCWLHRARGNLDDLGAEDLRFTPGWTVGWFFVPVMHFFRPFQAVSELWRASADPQGRWDGAGVGLLLPAWWMAWVASNLVGHVEGRLALGLGETSTIEQFLRVNSLGLASSAGSIVAAALFAAVVVGVQRRQAEALKRLRRIEAAARVAEAAEVARLARERAAAAS
jgi:hypothetical protein